MKYEIMKNKVEDIKVFKDIKAFRVYEIVLTDRINDEKTIYQNYKPTIKELKEFRNKYYRGY